MDRKTHPEYDSANDPEDELRHRSETQLVDEGTPDQEKDLVADAAEEPPEDLPAEESAVRVEEGAPGATDRPDPYLEDPGGS